MKEKFTLEQFIKKELQQEEHSFNEGLWSKLDQQLIPVRDAYHKKERRRVLFFWLPAGVLLIGSVVGVGTYFNKNNRNVKNIIVEKTTNDKEDITTTESQWTTSPFGNSSTKKDDLKNDNGIVNKVSEDNNLSSLNKKNTSSYSTIAAEAVTYSNKFKSKATPAKSLQDVANIGNTTAAVEDVVSVPNEIADKKNTVVDTKPVANKEVQPIEDAKLIEPTPSNTVVPEIKTKESKTKKENSTNPMEYYALGGINFSSPFNKGGYFGGVLMEKQVKDKRLFFGVKVAYNNLNHQLVATKNATVFPQTTDAMINKMTTIQVPFGYQFKLSKGSIAKATMLNVGFEPTVITGIQTIYYDDNGVPGGPRIAVVNSPLLSNAINKFNVSFIAGIRKQLSNKIGLNINAGYGLIDITDKQYYNKTNSNNNLKYVQLGLHYKLR